MCIRMRFGLVGRHPRCVKPRTSRLLVKSIEMLDRLSSSRVGSQCTALKLVDLYSLYTEMLLTLASNLYCTADRASTLHEHPALSSCTPLPPLSTSPQNKTGIHTSPAPHFTSASSYRRPCRARGCAHPLARRLHVCAGGEDSRPKRWRAAWPTSS